MARLFENFTEKMVFHATLIVVVSLVCLLLDDGDSLDVR